MSYKIDPAAYCSEDGCSRPATSAGMCVMCAAAKNGLAWFGSAEREDAAEGISSQPVSRTVIDDLIDAPEAKLPRCVAYLSQAGDVITLELTGEPKFTEADVALCASVLSGRNR
jgi:hypothetical protein